MVSTNARLWWKDGDSFTRTWSEYLLLQLVWEKRSSLWKNVIPSPNQTTANEVKVAATSPRKPHFLKKKKEPELFSGEACVFTTGCNAQCALRMQMCPSRRFVSVAERIHSHYKHLCGTITHTVRVTCHFTSLFRVRIRLRFSWKLCGI